MKFEKKRILIFGAAGAGKSTVINGLAEAEIAKVGDSMKGVTFKSDDYTFTHKGVEYTFIDTAGLNETEQGQVSAKEAAKSLLQMLKKNKAGFNLLIYVVKQERLKEDVKKNYDMFVKVVTQHKIKLLIVFTHGESSLNSYDDLKNNHWVNKKENQEFIKQLELKAADYQQAYFIKESFTISKERAEMVCELSRKMLWEKIEKHSHPEPVSLFGNQNEFLNIAIAMINHVLHLWGLHHLKIIYRGIKDVYDAFITMGLNEEEIKQML